MILDKNNKVRFILNGKQYCIRLIFCDYYMDSMPIFYSEDVHKITIAKLTDGSVLVISNKTFSKDSITAQFEIELWHSLLKVHYPESSNSLLDLYCATWFGFKNTIEFMRDNKSEDIEKRENTLNDYLHENNELNIPSKESVVSLIKFVEINDIGAIAWKN